jgi:3-hydroxyisobutyrate dehydrogenase
MSDAKLLGEPASSDPTALRDTSEPVDAAPPLGLIGLHALGLRIALTLNEAGHRLLVCDRDAERRAAYRAAAGPDAAITDDPAELGQRCTIVLLVQQLGDDATVLHGSLCRALGPGGLIVDMGPAVPGDLRRLAAELAASGLRLMDAVLIEADPPVLLVGGAEADRTLALPALQALGTVLPTGPVGSAQALAALAAELDTLPDLAAFRRLAAQQAAPW